VPTIREADEATGRPSLGGYVITLVWLCFIVTPWSAVAECDAVAQARSVIDQIVSLTGANDRRLADLYVDDAVLRERHRFENGK